MYIISDRTRRKDHWKFLFHDVQIIGVSEKAEKDEVVKTVMELKGSEIEDGYTMDVILSRQVSKIIFL